MARHNVLVLLSDEHDPRLTGAAGHRFARTPTLDRLAASGTRFVRAYTPSPVCVPARASLATGRWVHEIGYWDNAMGYDGREPGWGVGPPRRRGAGPPVRRTSGLRVSPFARPQVVTGMPPPLHAPTPR